MAEQRPIIIDAGELKQLPAGDTLPNSSATTSPSKDYIIDGDFAYWYEGTSSSTDGFLATMWRNNHIAPTTKVHTQQSMALGQSDVTGNPKYYSRTVVTTGGTAGAASYTHHNMEDVSCLAGHEVTLSFWAKADSSKNIALEYVQNFGTGGSPSASVVGIDAQKIAVIAGWVKYKVTTTLPSVSGKTLGTDDNDFLFIRFWFEAGSDFDGLTGSLGNQSGTFDIARVRLVKGSVDGDAIDHTKAEALRRVQRHFYHLSASSDSPNGYQPIGMFAVVTTTLARTMLYITPMRSDTHVFVYSGAIQVLGSGITYSSMSASIHEGKASIGQVMMNVIGTSGTVGKAFFLRFANDTDGYLSIDARL